MHMEYGSFPCGLQYYWDYMHLSGFEKDATVGLAFISFIWNPDDLCPPT